MVNIREMIDIWRRLESRQDWKKFGESYHVQRKAIFLVREEKLNSERGRERERK